ncbi:MAG: TMEM175 family protein [Planctomycetota bacterium]|jgi:uncharacterized membrane protein
MTEPHAESLLMLTPLDECPVKDGFRLRGLEMTRIETFTDAAFAFAVTLMVVSIDAIPTSFDELILAMKGIPAFAVSFLLLMLFWHGHWTWSRRYGLEDTPSILLSSGLVFVVLCYVYPLKFMTSSFFHWISGGALASQRVTFASAQQLHGMFVVYGIGFTAMCLAVALLNLHAYRCRAALQLDRLERFDTLADVGAWLIVAGTGVLSIILAMVTPASAFGIPGWAYMLLPITMPLFATTMARRRKRMREEMARE